MSKKSSKIVFSVSNYFRIMSCIPVKLFFLRRKYLWVIKSLNVDFFYCQAMYIKELSCFKVLVPQNILMLSFELRKWILLALRKFLWVFSFQIVFMREKNSKDVYFISSYFKIMFNIPVPLYFLRGTILWVILPLKYRLLLLSYNVYWRIILFYKLLLRRICQCL